MLCSTFFVIVMHKNTNLVCKIIILEMETRTFHFTRLLIQTTNDVSPSNAKHCHALFKWLWNLRMFLL